MNEAAMVPSQRVMLLSAIPLVLMAAFVVYVAYVADQILGVVAYTYAYLAFCLLTALFFGVAWRACLGKFGSLFALVVFGALAVNLVLPPPSDRILRTVMLKAPPGTEASAIADIVKQQYEGSPYEMPWIYKDRAGGYDRVHVSLLTQKAKNCTSVIFLLVDGRVSQTFFNPD